MAFVCPLAVDNFAWLLLKFGEEKNRNTVGGRPFSVTPPPLANVKHKVKSLTCIDISPSWDTHHGSRRRRKNIKQQEREREKCLILETESALPSFSRSSTRFQHPSTNDVPTTFKRASGNKMNDKLSSFIQGNYQELSNLPRHLFFSSKNIKKRSKKRKCNSAGKFQWRRVRK